MRGELRKRKKERISLPEYERGMGGGGEIPFSIFEHRNGRKTGGMDQSWLPIEEEKKGRDTWHYWR